MKQFWNWKKLLALSLAAALALTGGLFAWQWDNWFGGAGEPESPLASLEYPLPDPIKFTPRDPNPPPVQNYGPDPADFLRDEATGMEFVRGIAVVMFDRGATEGQMQAALAASGGELVGRADMAGKWQLRVPAEDYASLLGLCARLEAMPGVTAAMPDHVWEVALQAPPSDDPWTGSGASGTGDSNAQWAVIDRLPEAWAAFSDLAARPVKLGMVDSGVNTGHEELAGIAQHITTVNGFGAPYSYTPVPSYHGTAVAGVMAARANNGLGGAGVAWDAQVYAIDATHGTATVSEQMCYDGLLTLVREGVSAVNFSFGTIVGPGGITGDSEEEKEEKVAAHGRVAAAHLWQMISYEGETGFVVVQSAGNYRVDSIQNGFFASVTAANSGLTTEQAEMVMNRIVVVGALQQVVTSYQQWGSSAFGGVNQIYAPGYEIFTTNAGGASAYQKLSGTSMAAPQVTATAGWMFALNPGLDGGQVGALLKMPAVSPPVVKDSGGGTATYRMLDCVRALEAANTPNLVSRRADVLVVASPGEPHILLPDKTTAADLFAALDPVNGDLIYGKAQTPRLAGTGDEVKVRVKGATGLEATYILVVPGDLNGDGRVDALDAQCKLGLDQGTWTPPYSPEIYALTLGDMDELDLFNRGMD